MVGRLWSAVAVALLVLGGVVLGGVSAQAQPRTADEIVAALVGTWHDPEDRQVWVFDGARAFTLFRGTEAMVTGNFTVTPSGEDAILALIGTPEPSFVKVNFMGGPKAGFTDPVGSVEAAQTQAMAGVLLHVSKVDPRDAGTPSLAGTWISDDGTAVFEFGADGTGRVIAVGSYATMSTQSAGNLTPFRYKSTIDAAGVGTASIVMNGAPQTGTFMFLGRDVLQIGQPPGAEPVTPDTFRPAGVLIRAVEAGQ